MVFSSNIKSKEKYILKLNISSKVDVGEKSGAGQNAENQSGHVHSKQKIDTQTSNAMKNKRTQLSYESSSNAKKHKLQASSSSNCFH